MRISVACRSALNQQLLFLEIPLQRSYYSASRDTLQLVLPTDADYVLIELTVGLTPQGIE